MSEPESNPSDEVAPPSFGAAPSSGQPKPMKVGPVVPRPGHKGPFGGDSLPQAPDVLPSSVSSPDAKTPASSFLAASPPSPSMVEDPPLNLGEAPGVPATDMAPQPHEAPPASLDWDDAAHVVRAEEPSPEDVLADEADNYIGTTVGERYVVDSVLGEGGMGRVYGAHHKIIGKRVAIKVLHADLAKDKEAVSRFMREAQAASSIGNEHIVDISDFGELSDGATYFVMEYLDGESLGDLLERVGALKPDLVYHLALQICDGLAAAHSQQIVHRDLKPDNITILNQHKRDNFVKLLDFGIAKVSGTSNTKLTMAGAVFGTPHYMSPEQAAGTVVDHRTDIYSLGVVMYEMTSGEMPFNADNFMGILTQHMYKAPVPIRALVSAPECPPGLEAVILKCLSKKPDARYESMAELAEDLRRLQNGQVPAAVHDMMARSGSFQVPADYFSGNQPKAIVPGTPVGPQVHRRGPRLAAMAGIAAAVLIVAAVMLTQNASTANNDAPAPTTATAEATKPIATASKPVKAVKKVAVLLHAEPATAKAKQGTRSIPLPEQFMVQDGASLEVVVSAPGYRSKTVRLTGDKPKVGVKLVPLVRKAPAPTAAPQPKAAPAPRPSPRPRRKAAPTNAGGVVDPFG